MKRITFWTTIGIIGLILMVGGVQSARADYEINAALANDTAGSNTVTILLTLSGPSSIQISGFHFKIIYDSDQLTLTGAIDNIGQPSANVLYDLGPETKVDKKKGTEVFRRVLMTTINNLSMPGNLAKLTFTKKSGYTGASIITIEDGGPEDGLFDSNFKSAPHKFSKFGSK